MDASENILIKPYFAKLKNGDYAAYNGWIAGVDPLKDFAISDEQHYLRRTINIWCDLVKLRYG